MPRYQIIIETESMEFWGDYQIEVLIKRWFEKYSHESDEGILTKFKVLYVNNLQGLREEIFKKKEKLEDNLMNGEGVMVSVEQTFEDIEDLFKL